MIPGGMNAAEECGPGHDGLQKYPGTLAIVPWMPMMAGTLAM
jgi:hypothetical protein